MKEPAYRSFLPALGLQASGIVHVLSGVDYSVEWLHRARASLTSALGADWESGVAVFALGSIGRYEASASSDVDLGVVYIDDRFDEKEGDALWSTAVGALSALGPRVEQKTFKCAWPLSRFLRNIGGMDESNTELTYRALLLTEAAWLYSKSDAAEIRNRIFNQYSESTKSRGKYLTSLSNDLHRYYRTVCVDYRHKVEEKDKPWAIRVLKLRHSRKLWHLGNVAAQCSARLAEDFDATLAERIGDPPLLKIATALDAIDRLRAARDLFVAYDRFLAELARVDVRRELEQLDFEEKDSSGVYRRLRDNARDLQTGAAQVWQAFVGDERLREYLERFVIL